MNFDATTYWSDKPHKKWVVTIDLGATSETKFVGAADEAGAIQCALNNSSHVDAHRGARARLATPADLGCA